MTAPLDVARTWTWTGDRDLPDWLDRHHHWHTGRPVIHTTDGPRTLYHQWMVISWSDGAITVASATVAERVYGPDGIAGRLARAEAATDSEPRRQLADTIAALGRSETELADLREELAEVQNLHQMQKRVSRHRRGELDRAETALARIQALADEYPAGIDTTLIHAALDTPSVPDRHVYLSTGCLHGDHAYCQSMTGLNGAKRSGSCKHCGARCICGCHTTTKET